MQDRDTLYRINQEHGMECSFGSWIPGFSAEAPGTFPFSHYYERLIDNAERAGFYLESLLPNHFGSNTEAPFILTGQQKGKVRGDVFLKSYVKRCSGIAASLRILGLPIKRGAPSL